MMSEQQKHPMQLAFEQNLRFLNQESYPLEFSHWPGGFGRPFVLFGQQIRNDFRAADCAGQLSGAGGAFANALRRAALCGSAVAFGGAAGGAL